MLSILLRLGKNPMDAAQNFWVPDVFSAAMLFRHNDVYYLSTGRTPALLYVPRKTMIRL